MRVAVTGASGFIGSHVVDGLVDAGHDVTVIDRRPPHRDDVAYRDVDILDLEALVEATRGMEVIFHLAAVADVNEAAADPVGTWELNVVATARVWEAARRNDVRRTVLASTVWVYGGAVGESPLHEDAAFVLEDLEHVYTSSKVAAEMVAHAAHTLYGQEYTILRYGIPYGPRMRPALVIPRFVEAALNGEKLTVHGDGSQYRNYVYVEDLAAAHVLALGEAGANATFNLEGREAVSIRRLVDAIAAITGPVDVEYGTARAGDYEGRAVSADKAAHLLGWEPTTPFEVGLHRYVDWHTTARESRAPAMAAAPAERARTRARVEPRSPRRRAPEPVGRRVGRVLTAAAVALVLLPLLLGPAARTVAGHVPLVATVLLAAAVAWFVARSRSRPAPTPFGAVMVGASVWLLSQTDSVVVVALIAVALGVGVGLLLGELQDVPPAVALATGAAFVALASAGLSHVLAATAVAVAVAVVAAAPMVARVSWPSRPSRVSVAFCTATALFTVGLTSWVGATSASASWFGDIVSHGPRRTPEVALTFDASDSSGIMQVTSVLDRYGVKATFFAEGATSADRATARMLVAGGHEVEAGVDDKPRMAILRVGYPAAAHTQRELRAAAGVCAAFLRVPDGRHTPLMVRAVRHRGMRVVGWDVSPGRRSGRDSVSLALAVLRDVRPGSIIDLRGSGSVVAGALPLIIDGLRAKGLEPVGLDQLLHVTPNTGAC